MKRTKHEIRQELSETLLLCMDDIVCLAEDLESVKDIRLAEATRTLAGEIENLVLSMRKGGKHHG